ncbi:MAG: DUF2490 domain-containing protein [Chitinophagaceae bacterium]
MNPSARNLLLTTLLVGIQYLSFAQPGAASAVWWLPGVSWHPAKNTRILGQVGYNHYLRAGIFFPQVFITVHKNIVLNPAYIYLVQKKYRTPVLSEHYLMNAVILQATSKYYFIEDRNMLWNRIPVGSAATHYYRNRLKVGRILETGEIVTKLYIYDEIYYLFNNTTVTRNRIAFGINSELSRHINADIAYVRQWDRYSRNINLFFIMVILQF